MPRPNFVNISPLVIAVLEVVNSWLPPDDVDLDDPEYLIDCAYHIASALHPEPTSTPRRWVVTIPPPSPDLLRSIREAKEDNGS